MSRAALATASVALLTAGLTSACSSGDGSNPTGQNLGGRGPITYVEGKDTTETGAVKQLIDRWNAAHPNEQVTFKEQSNDASQQYDDLAQHMRAKQSDYDVMALDVPWTAEFAAKGWIQPLKDSFALDTSTLLSPTVASATYQGTLYAAPLAPTAACCTTARIWFRIRRRPGRNCWPTAISRAITESAATQGSSHPTKV